MRNFRRWRIPIKMEVDKLKEYMGENEKKQMKEDIAIQEAVTLIANAAVEG